MLPLHDALHNAKYDTFESKQNTDAIISILLDVYPEAATIPLPGSSGNELPLYKACYKQMSLHVLQKIVEAYPEAIHITNNQGSLPITALCASSPDVCLDKVQIYS